MRMIIYICIIVLSYLFLDIPQYNELNDIAIIEEISIEKASNIYTITLKEKRALKGSTGIEYLYDYYVFNSSSIESGFEHLRNHSGKTLVFEHLNKLVTNISNIKDELSVIDFKIDNIIYTNGDIDIKKNEP